MPAKKKFVPYGKDIKVDKGGKKDAACKKCKKAGAKCKC